VEHSLLAQLSHQAVELDLTLDMPRLVHHQILLCPSPRTSMLDTPKLSVLNVQMLLEVPFKKMDGSLNKPEIVELLSLDNFKVLNQLMLSSSMILLPLFSPKQLVQQFSSPILILPYAEPSQHALSKSMDVELITQVATWSSMPLPVPSPPSRTLMPVMKTLSASPAPTLVVLPSLRIPGR
jgi:hypothetical protein